MSEAPRMDAGVGRWVKQGAATILACRGGVRQVRVSCGWSSQLVSLLLDKIVPFVGTSRPADADCTPRIAGLSSIEIPPVQLLAPPLLASYGGRGAVSVAPFGIRIAPDWPCPSAMPDVSRNEPHTGWRSEPSESLGAVRIEVQSTMQGGHSRRTHSPSCERRPTLKRIKSRMPFSPEAVENDITPKVARC